MEKIEIKLDGKHAIEKIISNFRDEFGIYFEVQGNMIDLEYRKVEGEGCLASTEYIIVNVDYQERIKTIYLLIDDMIVNKKLTNMSYTNIILKSIIEKLVFNNKH